MKRYEFFITYSSGLTMKEKVTIDKEVFENYLPIRTLLKKFMISQT